MGWMKTFRLCCDGFHASSIGTGTVQCISEGEDYPTKAQALEAARKAGWVERVVGMQVKREDGGWAEPRQWFCPKPHVEV